MMKSVRVILVVILYLGLGFAGVDEDMQALEVTLKTNLDKCRATLNISEEELSTMYKNGTITNKGGCFLACFATEFGTMNSDYKFDREKIHKIMDPMPAMLKKYNQEEFYKNAIIVIDSCLDTQTGGSDACDSGKKAGECLMAGAKKIGMF